MDDDSQHPATREPDQLLKECEIQRTRRSGPGGQHRNKVETAVVIRHLPSGVRAEASERRSQPENQNVAVMRLRVNLAIEVRCPIPPEYHPSDLWKARCRGERIAVSPSHADFPALLAETLDVLAAVDMNLKLAGNLLVCTTSQLTKFLKLEPRALAKVNARRKELGLHPLQ